MNVIPKQLLFLTVCLLFASFNCDKTGNGVAVSRSKASIWVDTNRGSIFSSSMGSSHLQNKNVTDETSGRSSNFLLTLLLQPSQQPLVSSPLLAPIDSPNSNSNNTPLPKLSQTLQLQLQPVMLLLQQQQDLSQRLIEKQEKFEKINIQLQQQMKNQQHLIVELLDQIRVFLEAMHGSSALIPPSPSQRCANNDDGHNPHETSASSSAKATIQTVQPKRNEPETQSKGTHKTAPISVGSESETLENLENRP